MRESADGDAVDNRAGDKVCAAAVGALYQHRGEGDGGDENQTPVSTTLFRGHPGHIHRTTTGACPSGHHG